MKCLPDKASTNVAMDGIGVMGDKFRRRLTIFAQHGQDKRRVFLRAWINRLRFTQSLLV